MKGYKTDRLYTYSFGWKGDGTLTCTHLRICVLCAVSTVSQQPHWPLPPIQSSAFSCQSNLELIQQESLSLKHQLEVQRERSATALNKIQRQYFEESGRLRQEKALLEQEAEQAKATLLHKERSLSAAMATKTELQLEIQRLNEEKKEIKGEMRKEVCVCVSVCMGASVYGGYTCAC